MKTIITEVSVYISDEIMMKIRRTRATVFFSFWHVGTRNGVTQYRSTR